MRWDVIKSEITYRCRIFSVRRDESRSQGTGQSHDFHVLEANDWVNVVPLTADRRVVMVRQFRHGIRDLTLEVPAGLIDDTDAAPADAALRELREETGYASSDIAPIGTIHPNPAILNNRCHMFAAYNVVKVGAPQWDATEELTVDTIPLDQIPDLIRRGAISNALTVVAFHLFGLTTREVSR